MIYATEGVGSPYYAGLNLILLAIALIMRWSVDLSVTASLLVLAMYLTACFSCGPITASQFSIFVNNLYFLSLTAVIVIVGGSLHRKLRIREFTLRYELDQSKTELEETNRKLVELDQLKSHFFANISHELRTPLTLLLSPLETLMRRFNRSMDAKSVEMLASMHSNGLKLLKLINDLLALIRLGAGRMEVKNEPLEIGAFIKGFASAVKQVADDKRIKLETFADALLGVMLVDRDKLEKIVLNLLFNALKFTPNDGHVWLRAEKRDNQFVLIIGDTGVGIAEKSLPFVFDRFWQADATSKRKFQGVGIGLALVKELTEMMDGTVMVQSQEGKGATFTVRLPYQKGELPLIKPEAASPEPSENGAAAAEEWLTNLYRRAEFFPALSSLRETATPLELTGHRPVVLGRNWTRTTMCWRRPTGCRPRKRPSNFCRTSSCST